MMHGLLGRVFRGSCGCLVVERWPGKAGALGACWYCLVVGCGRWVFGWLVLEHTVGFPDCRRSRVGVVVVVRAWVAAMSVWWLCGCRLWFENYTVDASIFVDLTSY